MENISERIKELIAYLDLTAGDFAKKIGVQKSSISHLLSGRNKPSFSFLNKLTLTYPEINLRWLMTGKGNMLLNSDGAKNSSPAESIEKESISDKNEAENNMFHSLEEPDESVKQTQQNERLVIDKEETINHEVDSIIMIYDNDTFKILKKNKD